MTSTLLAVDSKLHLTLRFLLAWRVLVAGEDDAAATADVIEAVMDAVDDDDMVVVVWIVVVVTEPVLHQAAL